MKHPFRLYLSKGVFFMSKRARTSKIEKWIKEGRGSGVGSEYKPWLNIQDVASKGRSIRLKGIKTNRQHEFLSDLERNYFYLTEYSDFVVDIREQFPLLPLEETIVIADELGIKHPTDPKTHEPIVMTTDFLLTVDKGEGLVELARTIKMKDELLKERVIEKFEIERDLIVERTQEGKEIAKQRPGFKEGRPKKFSKQQLGLAMQLLETHSYSEVEKMTGISKSTLTRHKRKMNNDKKK